ncbi:hypothetical protein [Aurantimonas sp. Leaf443]|nr:hypothetical protein [Aurantimonas sp. Leaf443]
MTADPKPPIPFTPRRRPTLAALPALPPLSPKVETVLALFR